MQLPDWAMQEPWKKAYLEFSGAQVFVPGVIESGPRYGLIPSTWTVQTLLGACWVKWISDPAPGAKPKEGENYELLRPGWRPKQVKFFKYGGAPVLGLRNDTIESTEADFIQLSNYQVEETPSSSYMTLGSSPIYRSPLPRYRDMQGNDSDVSLTDLEEQRRSDEEWSDEFE